jgi:hypothetical protein
MDDWNTVRSAFGMHSWGNQSPFLPPTFPLSKVTNAAKVFYYTDKGPRFFYFILSYFRHSAYNSLKRFTGIRKIAKSDY